MGEATHKSTNTTNLQRLSCSKTRKSGGENKKQRRGSKNRSRRVTERLQSKAWIISLEPLTSHSYTSFICFHKNIIRLLIVKLPFFHFPTLMVCWKVQKHYFPNLCNDFEVTSVQLMQIIYSNLCTYSTYGLVTVHLSLSQPEPEHTYPMEICHKIILQDRKSLVFLCVRHHEMVFLQ